MPVNGIIFKELMRRGYSLRGERRVWNISDAKLWFLTPELSKGFVKLKEGMPSYRKNILEPELNLLRQNADKIASFVEADRFNVIDLCAGTGGRAAILIKHIPDKYNLRYGIVNINPEILKIAISKLGDVSKQKVLEIRPFLSDFNDLSKIFEGLRVGEFQKNLVLMLGSRISNYEINEILFTLSSSVSAGDAVVLGNGLRKGEERFVDIDKYKNPFFNQWFIYIMKGLGFKENELEFDARFENYRVEIFYKIKVDKEIEYSNRKISFQAGDEVIVAVQYKYYEQELKDFCRMYFSDVDVIKTANEEYGLFVCRK